MNNDYILSVIREYAAEYLKEPRRRLPKGLFERRSYQRWAVDEILRSIDNSKHVSPIVVVENFIRKTEAFSHRNSKANLIFSVAHDVATDILDILLAMKG